MNEQLIMRSYCNSLCWEAGLFNPECKNDNKDVRLQCPNYSGMRMQVIHHRANLNNYLSQPLTPIVSFKGQFQGSPFQKWYKLYHALYLGGKGACILQLFEKSFCYETPDDGKAHHQYILFHHLIPVDILLQVFFAVLPRYGHSFISEL